MGCELDEVYLKIVDRDDYGRRVTDRGWAAWRSRVALAAGLGLVPISVAPASGGVFPPRHAPADARPPSVARERVLVIYDAEQGREHIIAARRFRNALEPFAFVMPAPTQPDRSDYVEFPFARLREQLPFDPTRTRQDKDDDVEHVQLSSISVLDARVGTSLSPRDDLAAPSGIERWAERHAAMGFFYLMGRYDSLNTDLAGSEPEYLDVGTELTSFTTPMPYLAYSEPPRAGARGTDARLLELWYVDTKPRVPVAVHENGASRGWVRPLREGEVFRDARGRLEAILPAELQALLPEGELVLQTFQDQKSDRTGFGDILFAYTDRHDLDPQARADLAGLLGVLNSGLRPEVE